MTTSTRFETEQFLVSVQEWGKKVSEDADAGTRAIVARLFNQIILYTPVGDPTYWKSPPPPGYVGGFARANWHVTINVPGYGLTLGQPGQPPIGGDAIPEIQPKVNEGGKGDVFYLNNGVPYIWELENGTGSPRQAPNGMVARAFAEAEVFYGSLPPL